MDENQTGQVTNNAAETYEEFFVPALFQEWAERVVDAAQIEGGQHVLDVACGTGVLARAAARRVGPKGSVIGLDVNEGMLAVAQRKALKSNGNMVVRKPFLSMTTALMRLLVSLD